MSGLREDCSRRPAFIVGRSGMLRRSLVGIAAMAATLVFIGATVTAVHAKPPAGPSLTPVDQLPLFRPAWTRHNVSRTKTKAKRSSTGVGSSPPSIWDLRLEESGRQKRCSTSTSSPE